MKPSELDAEFERLGKNIQLHKRHVVFWGLFGAVSIVLVIIARLIRVLVIG